MASEAGSGETTDISPGLCGTGSGGLILVLDAVYLGALVGLEWQALVARRAQANGV